MRKSRKSRRLFSKSTYQKLKLISQFVIVFNILSLPMYLVMYYDLAWTGVQDFVASVASATLRAMGYSNSLSGHDITVAQPDGPRRVEVSWDSSGWKTVYAMFSLIVATPLVRLGRKLRYIAVLLPLVFLVNVARVVTTIGISVTFGFAYFDLVHLFLWRYFLIGTILALWMAYLRRESIIMNKNQTVNVR